MAAKLGDEFEVEVVDHPLSDDYMNIIEVACAAKPKGSSSEEQPSMIGVSFLNKHCLITDLAGNPLTEDQEPLLKRSYELKLEILQNLLGWQLLIVDEEEFTRLGSKAEKEGYIMDRLQVQGQHVDMIKPEKPEPQAGRRVRRRK